MKKEYYSWRKKEDINMAEKMTLFIKIKKDRAPNIEKILKESLATGEERPYYPTERDKTIIEGLPAEEMVLAALIHEEGDYIELYLGTCKKCGDKKGEHHIRYKIRECLKNNIALRNICKLSEIDVEKDFENSSYLLPVESPIVSKQIDIIIKKPVAKEKSNISYNSLEQESSLHSLAQRNEYCIRQYREDPSQGSEFFQDYERILQSKAFRRMVDKAQIFSSEKGDHYRTRMTHSQIVELISTKIARELQLNLDLTAAIALGHDIGHTPFGHQGERTLDNILKSKTTEITTEFKGDASSFGKMRFKHNYQSVKVATMLEERASGRGLNLSAQTLEGLLKHTKFNSKEYDINDFLGDEIELFLEKDFCSTLEGQIVEKADEIAQRAHDLDDAFSAEKITKEELLNLLSISKMSSLKEAVEGAIKDVEDSKKAGIRITDEKTVVAEKIVCEITEYFVRDVVKTSLEKMNKYKEEEFKANNHRVAERLIAFSPKAETLNSFLERIIKNLVLNSQEIALFDNNADIIVESLFNYYYNKPLLLHSGTKRRIYYAMRKQTTNVIDLEYGDYDLVKKELNMITSKEPLDKSLNCDSEEYFRKRIVLIRGICDYIAGMTDSYARKEYEKFEKRYIISTEASERGNN